MNFKDLLAAVRAPLGSTGARKMKRNGGGGGGSRNRPRPGERIPRALNARMDQPRHFTCVSNYGTQAVAAHNSLAKTLSWKWSDMPGAFSGSLQGLFDLFTIDRLEIVFAPSVTAYSAAYDSAGTLKEAIPMTFYSAMDRAPGSNIGVPEEVPPTRIVKSRK